jgi:uncharacterized Fe-S cluster protein YjdI
MGDDETQNRKRAGVEREYRDDKIVVYWAPEFCIHTAMCLNAEPDVFDSTRRPWVVLDEADADRVAAAVMQCPTGALTFERLDGAPGEGPPDETAVQARRNGPLFLRGKLRFYDSRGELVREAPRAALCRCGGSQNKPGLLPKAPSFGVAEAKLD